VPEKRAEPRFLCSDLVTLRWLEERGIERRETVVLENISASGACVQAEVPVSEGSHVSLSCRSATFLGCVRSCYLRDDGYFIGIAFDEGHKWSKARFQPEHLLDPSKVRPRKVASKLIMFVCACLGLPANLFERFLRGLGRVAVDGNCVLDVDCVPASQNNRHGHAFPQRSFDDQAIAPL
jgi:hypothetical protein